MAERGRVLLWIVVPVSAFGLVATLATGGATASDLNRGRSTYKELCAKCHGPDGKGDGKEAATLKTKPQDLSDCARMVKFTDDELFRAIKEGGPAIKQSKDMPAYSESLEDDEIQDVLAFVRTLCVR